MSQISEGELRFIHYWYGSVNGGKKFLLRVLHIFTEGKINSTSTFKDILYSNYDYLIVNNLTKKTKEGLYKQDFTQAERDKLEDPSVDIGTFDVTIAVKLLQRLSSLTGFAHHNDPIWFKDEPAGTNHSLEYLIYQLKLKRNDASHAMRSLSEAELSIELKSLEDLYTKLLTNVLTVTGKAPHIIRDTKHEIKDFFDKLRCPIREALTDKDIAAFKKEKHDLEAMLTKEVRDKSQIQLKDHFQGFHQLKPAGFMDFDLQYDMMKLFTKIVIKDEEKHIPNSGPVYERKIDYEDILNTKTVNQETPQVFTVSSPGGNGKTVYTRFFIYKWCLAQLKKFDLLLLSEFRNETSKSLDQFIRNYLGNVMDEIGISFENLKNIILKMNVLVVMDGFDESEETVLLKNILKITETHNNFTTMITTRPTAALDLQKIISGFKLTHLQLQLMGIDPKQRFEFIKKLVVAMESDQDKIDKILASVEVDLPLLNESMGELTLNPLMLTLMTFLWVFGEIPDSATTTIVFMKLNELLRGKLKTRILQKFSSIIGSFDTGILDFEVFFNKFSFETFSRKEFSIKDSSMAEVRNKLRQLSLGHFETDIMEHYLAPRRSRRMLVPVITYTQKHLRLQEYSASQHVCHVLATGTEDKKSAILGHLKEERYSNVRAHTIALLSEGNPALLDEHCKCIIGFEKDGEEVDSLLNIVFESNKHPTVVRVASDNMKRRRKWKVCSTSVIPSLIEILKHVQPEALELDFKAQTELPQTLLQYLQTIARAHSSMKVELSFPSGINTNATEETHEKYLLALSNPASSTTLTTFAGRIDTTVFPDLPSSLTTLNLGFQMDGLPLLMQRIQELPQLEILMIAMRCPGPGALGRVVQQVQAPAGAAPGGVAAAAGPTQPLANLWRVWVHLSKCCDADTVAVAALAQHCYNNLLPPSRRRRTVLLDGLWLVLPDAAITGVGGVALLQRLVDLEVNCYAIVIMSSHLPNHGEEDTMRRLAGTCVTGTGRWAGMAWRCGDVTRVIK